MVGWCENMSLLINNTSIYFMLVSTYNGSEQLNKKYTCILYFCLVVMLIYKNRLEEQNIIVMLT